MKEERRFIKDNRHLLVLLTVLSVMITVWSLPKERIQRYSYTVGKPWTYEMLIAPFSFSIEKSEDVLQAEYDSVKAAFAPYFSRSQDVSSAALKRFENFYTDSLHRVVPPETYASLYRKLEQVYSDGIISLSGEEILAEKQYLRIYEGNTSAIRPVSSVSSVRDAYRSIVESDDIPPHDRYVLLQYNLDDFIQPDMTYDEARSQQDLEAQQNRVSHYLGMVVSDQKIVDQGEIVTPATDLIIRSYLKTVNDRAVSKRFQILTWGGQIIFSILFFLILFVYLWLYRVDDIDDRAILYFLMGSVTLFIVCTSMFVQYSSWSIFIFPCAMLPILLRVFLDSRTAFTGYLVYILTTSVFVSVPHEFLLLEIAAGLTGIYSLKELSQRSQILRTCLLVFIVYGLGWAAIQMIRLENISDIDFYQYIYFAINCILLLLLYPLLAVVEKLFGFTSNVTLVELSNFSHPLLLELADKAPGTFQHSIQVSTLASEAAKSIKASPQLVRTGALYHDIGKTANAPYFTENQSGVNPHDQLTAQESARVITDHVESGLALAEKYGLPPVIRDFIRTHHGNGVARYFFIRYQQEHPGEQPDEAAFSYPGPNPQTKEQAILMMADAVEAASRSLKEYTEDSIADLVDRIIDNQVAEGYFRESPLNWQEMAKIREVFKEKLKTTYHTRISYPEPTAGLRQRKR